MGSWWRLIALLAICGCGSSGPPTAAHGQVILPSGLPAANTFTVTTETVSNAPVAADGSFTVPVTGGGPVLVVLRDAAGKIVLMSYVDPTQSGEPAQVSVKQTAVAMLYLALGGFGLNPADMTPVLTALRADNATATLAFMLTTVVTANVTAFTDGDPRIDQALGVAVNFIAQETPPTTRTVIDHARRLDGATPLILIEPSPGVAQSGVNVLDKDGGGGIVLQNNFRRDAQFRVFKTGHQVQGQPPDMLTIVGDPLVGEDGETLHRLESTQALKGAFGSITNVAVGKVPFAPVKSEGVDLTVDDGALKTFYQVVLIGPTLNASNLGPAMTDPIYAGLHADFQQTSIKLGVVQFLRQVMLPLLAQVLLPNDKVKDFLAEELPPAALAILENQLTDVFLDSVSELADDLGKGHYAAAVTDILSAFAEHAEFRMGVIDGLTDMLKTENLVDFANFESADDLLTGLAKANEFIKLVNAAMTGFDVTVQLKDLATSRMTEVWTVTAVRPTVHLEPNAPTITFDTSVIDFSATVPGQSDPSKLRFVWSTSGAMGHLEDSSGTNQHPVTGGPVTDSTVLYVADLAQVRDGLTDTVSVTVFTTDDLVNEIGDSQAVVTAMLSTATCDMFPAPIASVCGEVNLPFIAKPGQSFTVGVVVHAGGACGNGANLNLNGTPVSGATVDGLAATDPNSIPLSGTVSGTGTMPHTVVYQISGNAPDQCPVSTPNADPNLIIPMISGPWAVLNEGTGGNAGGWTTQRPFVVER